MRIRINFTKNTEKVFNNQNVVNSYIHKCFGINNDLHDTKSDYCVSNLCGGKLIDNGAFVNYENGGFIIFSSPNSEIVNKLLIGILNNPIIGYGMVFSDVITINERLHDGYNHFKTLSNGFIVKNKSEFGFLKLTDGNFIEDLEKHTINKFSKINPKLDFSNFKIEISEHPSHKTKNIYVNKIKNISNVCQLTIHSNKDVVTHIYNYGLGQSTGSGFGTLFRTENIGLYK